MSTPPQFQGRFVQARAMLFKLLFVIELQTAVPFSRVLVPLICAPAGRSTSEVWYVRDRIVRTA